MANGESSNQRTHQKNSGSSGFLNTPIPTPEVLYFPVKPRNKSLEKSIRNSLIIDTEEVG